MPGFGRLFLQTDQELAGTPSFHVANQATLFHSDNVYSIMAVFGLALAYRRVDDDEGRACKCACFMFL